MFRLLMVLGCLLAVGGVGEAAPVQMIRPDAVWRVRTLAAEAPAGWEGLGFDDSGWLAGPAAFSVGYGGYQSGATVLPWWTGTDPVRGLVARREFVVDDPGGILTLTLRVDYEDGLMLWLNGEEVGRYGVPAGPRPAWDTVAAMHPAGESGLIDLTPWLPRLRSGVNLLAMQVFDANAAGGSLFLWPELRMNFARGPIVQNVSTNAATVVWRAPGPAPARVEIRAAEPGDGVLWRVVRAEAGLPAGDQQAEVIVDRLDEGTAYEYRVVLEDGERNIESEPATFRTLRSSGDVDFLVVGDTGASTLAQYEVAAALARERADLALHLGDIVYPGFTRGRVDLRCLSVHEPGYRSMPWFFTFGNHDVYEGEAGYLETFVLPRNDLTGGEQFYSFDHGDAHFVSLFVPWWGLSQIGAVGADGSRSAQYRWLTNDLARTTKPWKIVFFHQPLRTSGPHGIDDYNVDGLRDVAQMQEHLLPLLAAHGVQLVLNGHDHDWERFAPTDGLHVVVSGGGGAFLYTEYIRDVASARFVSRHHFARVRIRGDEMNLEAVAASGEVFDRFSIRRAGGLVNAGEAPWREAVPWVDGVPNADGNIPGETFDLDGAGLAGISSGSANPGRLVAAADAFGIHLGLRDMMLWPGQTVALFVGAATVPGVSNLAGVGALSGHPLGRLPLRFDEAFPSVVALVGDERVDGNSPDHVRPGASVALGQGVHHLDAGLTPVAGARLRQFNRSPESDPDPQEQNANFSRMALPWGGIRGGLPGGTLRAGAVVVEPVPVGFGEHVAISASYVGSGWGRLADGSVRLAPVELRIGDEPTGDFDLDGLSLAHEEALGTDPRDADTDDDTLPDGWEVRHGLDPLSGAGSAGAEGDRDGDGYTNGEEYLSGTDPGDPVRTLTVVAGRWRGAAGEEGVRLVWRATVGREYVVEGTGRVPGIFSPLDLPGFPRKAASNHEEVIVSWSGEAAGWFRIRELPRVPGGSPMSQ